MAKARIDAVIEKYASKKLLVWVISTILMIVGTITASMWMSITLGYIGAQGFVDLAVKWKEHAGSTPAKEELPAP
jgi:hypothetical protein